MKTMSAPSAGTWRDAHDVSKLRFAVPYLGITRITGIFREHQGRLTVDDSGRITSVELDIIAASVDVGDEYRNDLVTSMDFLDIESYPLISFRSTEVMTDGNDLEVVGHFRVNGIAQEVQIRGRVIGVTESATGEEYLGIEASGALSRSAFGLREPSDPATRAQPDADLVWMYADLAFTRQTT